MDTMNTINTMNGMEPKDVNTVYNGLRSVSSSSSRMAFDNSSVLSPKEDAALNKGQGRGILQSRIPVKSLMANFENPGSRKDSAPLPPNPPRQSGRRYDPRAVQSLGSNRKVNAIIQPPPVSPRRSPLLRRKFPQTQLPNPSSPTSSSSTPSSPSDFAQPLPVNGSAEYTRSTGGSYITMSSSPAPSPLPIFDQQIQTHRPSASLGANNSLSEPGCTISSIISWPTAESSFSLLPPTSSTQHPGTWMDDGERPHTIISPDVQDSDDMNNHHSSPRRLFSTSAGAGAPKSGFDSTQNTLMSSGSEASFSSAVAGHLEVPRSIPAPDRNYYSDEYVSRPSEAQRHTPDELDDCSSHSESSIEALENFYNSVDDRPAPLQYSNPGRAISAETPIAISQASAAIAMAEASSFVLRSPATVVPHSNSLTVPESEMNGGSSCDGDEDDWEARVSDTIFPSDSASMVGVTMPAAASSTSSFTPPLPHNRKAMIRQFVPPPLKPMEMTQICAIPILSPKLDLSPGPSPQFSQHSSSATSEAQPTTSAPVSSILRKIVDVGTNDVSAPVFYRGERETRSTAGYNYMVAAPSIPPPPPPPPPKESAGLMTRATHSRASSDTQGRRSGETETYSNLYNKLLPDTPVPSHPNYPPTPRVDSNHATSHVPQSEQMTRTAPAGAMVSTSMSATTPSFSESQVSVPRTEQGKKLVDRRYVLKEFVDTERSFHNDMMILNNIYKGTSEGVLSDIDRRTLFGNIEQVCTLSGKLADAFRIAADPAYAAKHESRKSGTRPMSEHVYPTSPFVEWPEDELRHYDVRTELGQVLCENMADVHEVYGYYLKNHTWANSKLTDLESDRTVAQWLEECRASASDLTTAWNLNALLVKPMQRVTKYPLMLRTLLKSTFEDHPDRVRIERSIEDLDEKLRLWNESQDSTTTKKEHDLFPKLGNRRGEKKQQVGIANSLEDPEYDKLSQRFGGHFFQLQIVIRDVNAQIDALQTNMTHHTMFVATAEVFCRFDQQHAHAEAHSGLVTYSRIVSDMATVGLPRHVAGMRKHVLNPLEQLWKLHEGPQELMRRRKKRSVEYYRWKQLVGRGETPDRKLREGADQFKSLNDRLKDELPKLYELSRRLVKACLDNLIALQSQWNDNWVRKLDLAARHPPRSEDVSADIRQIGEEYITDFGYVHSRLRELGLCNGNLRSLADPSGFLASASASSSWEDPATARGRAGTISSSYRTGSAKSDVEVNRLSATTFASAFGRSTVDVGSASARSSRGPITPQSISQAIRPGLSKAPSFSSTRSGRHNHQRAAMIRPSSGAAAIPPRASLDLPGGGDEYSTQTLTLDDMTGPEMSMQSVGNPHNHLRTLQSYQSLPSNYMGEPLRSPTKNNPFSSSMPVDAADGFGRLGPMDDDDEAFDIHNEDIVPGDDVSGYKVLFVAASLYEFQVDDTRSFVGFPYLQYSTGEIFDVIGQNGELWMARNQDDMERRVGWIWERHFARILPEEMDDM